MNSNTADYDILARLKAPELEHQRIKRLGASSWYWRSSPY